MRWATVCEQCPRPTDSMQEDRSFADQITETIIIQGLGPQEKGLQVSLRYTGSSGVEVH